MYILLASLLFYLAGTLTIAWPRKIQLQAHYFGMMCAVIASVMVAGNSINYLLFPGGELLLDVAWGQYSLTADGWSGVFLAIAGIAGGFISIYAIDYAKGYLGNRLRALTGLWNLFLLSIVAVLLAGDAFTFLVAWEIMALVSFLLVNHEASKKETVAAAYQYMVMTHLGTGAIMIAFYLLGSQAASFSFADLAVSNLNGYMRHIAFLCAFAGFALKSGLIPLHIWLPNAHPAAPSHVSALMSGVMLKVALYGFGRFVFQFIGMDVFWYGLLVAVIGLLSAFLGVLYAAMETDMKRILAYSSVENMGIIFAAFGCGMLLMAMHLTPLAIVAFVAAMLHAFSHSLMKGLMFMSAGAVMHGTGSKNIEKMGGLGKKMPYTAFFTLIGAMALSALPFTCGFAGEWLVLQSYITLAQQAGTPELRLFIIFAFVLLGLTGATALGCFVRLYGIVFLGRPRTRITAEAHEQPFFMLCGMGIAAFLVVAAGLLPDLPVNVMQRVLAAPLNIPMGTPFGLIWGGSGQYAVYSPVMLVVLTGCIIIVAVIAIKATTKGFVRQDVTWNCGTVPTSRQQYTATGFSKPLRRAFENILNPQRRTEYLRKEHAYYGRKIKIHLEIPDLFMEKLYKPVQGWMIASSSAFRHVQEGSVSLYIGYTMIAMLFVLIWGVL